MRLAQNGLMFQGTLYTGYDMDYSYGTNPGTHYQLRDVAETSYRTSVTPAQEDLIQSSHSYSYDPNGNLAYESVARKRIDNSTTRNISERKLLWDAQNRLRGISENGYVSLYWYDAEGNRTVKEHLGGEAVWVNSAQAGQRDDVPRWTAYPSGFITVEDGARYTQHIYIGTDRVASLRNTLGDEFTNYSGGTVSAGNGVQIPVSYTVIRDTMEASADRTCAGLDVPWHIPHTVARSDGARCIVMAPMSDGDGDHADDSGRQGRTVSTNSIYYYHRDHLGSTMSVSDKAGNTIQQVEYTPWGEVFVEFHGGNTFSTPYLFNGKELDEETGLYYYGARYYDPKLSVWYSVDPWILNDEFVFPYVINNNNPLRFIDQNGERPKPAEAARIAAHVYGDKTDNILIGGWRVSHRNFKNDLKLRDSAGLKYKIYERVVNGIVTEYVYATAGTDDWRDVVEDILQPFGLSKQYHIAAENAKKISDAIGDKELTYVGHSLGGGEAALNSILTYSKNKKGRTAITFNAAGVSDITKFVEGSWNALLKSENSIDAYILRTDPLNLYQNNDDLLPDVNGKRHYLSPKDFPSVYNGHSIDNVLKNFGVSNPNQYQKEK